MTDRELTVNDIAQRLNISTERVRARIKEGRIKARREGRELRIKESEFQRYLKQTEQT